MEVVLEPTPTEDDHKTNRTSGPSQDDSSETFEITEVEPIELPDKTIPEGWEKEPDEWIFPLASSDPPGGANMVRSTGVNCMPLQRLQLELPEEKLKEIETVMQETGIKTNKELVSNALALFLWSIREVKNGRMIASVDEANGKYKEIRMPAFEFVLSKIGPAASFADLLNSEN